MSEFIDVEGKAYWAQVRAPSKMSGKFEVEIGNLSPKAKAKLEALGIKVKTDEAESDLDKGLFFKAKTQFKVPVVDAADQPVADDVLIGNGSRVIVRVSAYAWKFGAKKGVGANLVGIQLLDLVKYEGKAKTISFGKKEGFGNSETEVDPADDFIVDDE